MDETPESEKRITDADWPEGVPGAGETIGGKYVCERLLGTGGMGVVLAGRHETLGQKVAIKVLLPDTLRDPIATERFLREARAAIAIRSDHIARVIDFGTLESGSPYLVMEHLEGNDLKHMLATKGPLGSQCAVDYVIQACEALCEAHRRGIVHRDLKPANLFLASRVDGSPLIKVLDFGISKTVSAAASTSGSGAGITRTDAVFGTPAYMSPEQLRSSKLVDHRTDIWSLGVVLYELITSRLPFGALTDGVVAMCAHILEDAPPSLRISRPSVPTALEQVIVRCLAKNPEGRYQTIGDLTAALVPFSSPASAETAARIARISADSLPFDSTIKSDSGPVSVQSALNTSSAWGRTRDVSRRRSLVMIMVGIIAVGFAVGGAWILGSRSGSQTTLVVSSASATSVVAQPMSSVPASASSTPPAVASLTPVPASESAVAGASPHSSSPPAATTRSTAPAASAKPEPSKSSAPQPTCPSGEVLSNGHCCKRGFEFKGGECVPGIARPQ